MRSASLDTQLYNNDVACNVQDWSAGVYEGAQRFSSLDCFSQDTSNLQRLTLCQNITKHSTY